MHIPPMLPQMILAREPILAHAPAPFLRAVVTGRDFREMGGGVAGEVEGTGELAGAEGVEAGEGCCFRRRGGVVGRGDGGAVGGGAGVSLGCVLFWGGRLGEERREWTCGKEGGRTERVERRERKKIGIGARKGRRRNQESEGWKDNRMTERGIKRIERPTLNHR